MANGVTVVVKIMARQDKVDETRDLLLWLAEQSRAEHGCALYDVLENIYDPDIFLIHEEWESHEALIAHGESAHVAEAFRRAASLVASAPDRGVYRTVG